MPPIQEIPGSVAGRFRLIERIGGPRSSVWRAEDSEGARQVVIRILSRSLPADPARRAALLERVRQRVAFHHPALPSIEAVTIEGDALLLREELLAGTPLAAVPKPLDASGVLKLAFQIAGALQTLHARGLVHGALDPTRVLAGTDGSYRLTGLSLAALTAREDRGEERLLRSTERADLLELSFRAPEQISARGVEVRSDVFSLGAVLYDAATGRAPFIGSTPTEIATAILRGSPPSPLELNPRLPIGVIAMIGKCLMKDPVKRFQDVQHLVDDLRRMEPTIDVLAARPVEARSRSVARTTDSPFVVGVLPYFELLDQQDPEKASRLAARMQQTLGEAALLADGAILASLGAQFVATFPSPDAAIDALRRAAADLREQNTASGSGEILEPTVLAHAGALTVEHGAPAGAAFDLALKIVTSMEPGQMLITGPVAEAAGEAAGATLGSVDGIQLFPVRAEIPAEDPPLHDAAEPPPVAAAPKPRLNPFVWLAPAAAVILAVGTVFLFRGNDGAAPSVTAPASVPAPGDPRPQLVLEPFAVDGTDPEIIARAAALEDAVRAMLASSPDLRLLEAPASDAARTFQTRTPPGGTADQIMVYSLAGTPAETRPLSLSDPSTATEIAAWIAERSGVPADRIATSSPDAISAFIDALAATRSQSSGANARAAAAIRKSLVHDPDFLPAARFAVTILSADGDRKGAVAAAETVVRLDPADSQTRRLLFDWSREAADVPAAIRHGAATLQAGTPDTDVLLFLAREALGAGDWEAFERLHGRLQRVAGPRALPLHPADAAAARGQLGVAVQQYYALEPAERDNPFLSLKIGRIDVLRHSTPAAELELEKLRILDPQYSAELLAAYLAAGRRDANEAAAGLARAAAAPNRAPDFHTSEAEVYAILSDHRGVLRSLGRAVDAKEPTFAYILSNPLFAYLQDEREFAPLRARMRTEQQERRASLAEIRP